MSHELQVQPGEPRAMSVGRAAGAIPTTWARSARTEPAIVRYVLIGGTMTFLGLLLVVPLVAVFAQAFSRGTAAYWAAVTDPETWSAIKLTLITAGVAVPANLVFGVAAAWALGKFEFRGRNILITLIDLPFAVSPVISGLIYVLIFGAQGWLGPWLAAHDIKIIFAVPGIILATVFVTFPLVARELIPLLKEQGTQQEEVALTLGASGWQTFWRVTLPSVRWGLLYGVILCTARAIGEFGAVSVVSGHVRGEDVTMTLHVEILYNENVTAAFAVASLLTLPALAAMVIKALVERRERRRAGTGGHAR